MKKIINTTHLEGYLFAHTLAKKESGPNAKTPGTEYIAGTIEIATDEEGLNVVPVTFRYVVAKTKKGANNATFATLSNIIASEKKTWQDVGADAMKLKVDSAIGVNDFYNAEDELITYKLTDGGFVHVINSFSSERNHFEADVIIYGATLKEADADRGYDEMLLVKAYTFNFMGSALPIDLAVKNADGIKYFDGLEASPSEPVFMKVWGKVVASTVETQTTEESAFGADAVKVSTRRLREWVITGAAADAYPFDDASTITKEELTEALQNREVYLAGVKKSHDEYMANKNNTPAAPAAGIATPQVKGFGF